MVYITFQYIYLYKYGMVMSGKKKGNILQFNFMYAYSIVYVNEIIYILIKSVPRRAAIYLSLLYILYLINFNQLNCLTYYYFISRLINNC